MNSPLITLTTDFGLRDPYAAAMKGVIWSICPNARIVDLTHEIGPQHVREAALFLMQVVAHFPAGTIHLVVVDPGVGTDRRLVCARIGGQLFLAPDNGVLSWVRPRSLDDFRVQLTDPRYWRPSVSDTFHGRDILAPAAAHLALGITPQDLGPTITDCVEIGWPRVVASPGRIDGEVLAVDRFGNLISNIARADVIPLTRTAGRVEWAGRQLTLHDARCYEPHADLWVECAGREVGPLLRTYADVETGRLLALVGSSDLVEIAVRNGSAAGTLQCSVGARVSILAQPPE